MQTLWLSSKKTICIPFFRYCKWSGDFIDSLRRRSAMGTASLFGQASAAEAPRPFAAFQRAPAPPAGAGVGTAQPCKGRGARQVRA